jgi:hypothetical protein
VSLRPAPAVGRPEAGSSAAAVIVVGVPEPGRVHVLDPIEPVWSRLKRSLANLTKHDIAELTALVKTRLKRMQYRPASSWPASSPAPGCCMSGSLTSSRAIVASRSSKSRSSATALPFPVPRRQTTGFNAWASCW